MGSGATLSTAGGLGMWVGSWVRWLLKSIMRRQVPEQAFPGDPGQCQELNPALWPWAWYSPQRQKRTPYASHTQPHTLHLSHSHTHPQHPQCRGTHSSQCPNAARPPH